MRTLAAAEPLDVQWLDNRALWREQLRAALARRDDPVALAAALETLFLAPERSWSAGYRAATERNRERYVTLLVELDATFTPSQRARLQQRLAAWVDDLRGLARR